MKKIHERGDIQMAYLLFRDHNMTPSQYYDLGANERAMLRAFIRQECQEREELYKEQSS